MSSTARAATYATAVELPPSDTEAWTTPAPAAGVAAPSAQEQVQAPPAPHTPSGVARSAGAGASQQLAAAASGGLAGAAQQQQPAPFAPLRTGQGHAKAASIGIMANASAGSTLLYGLAAIMPCSWSGVVSSGSGVLYRLPEKVLLVYRILHVGKQKYRPGYSRTPMRGSVLDPPAAPVSHPKTPFAP